MNAQGGYEPIGDHFESTSTTFPAEASEIPSLMEASSEQPSTDNLRSYKAISVLRPGNQWDTLPGHVTREKTSQLSRLKTPQMPGASREILCYAGVWK